MPAVVIGRHGDGRGASGKNGKLMTLQHLLQLAAVMSFSPWAGMKHRLGLLASTYNRFSVVIEVAQRLSDEPTARTMQAYALCA